MHARQRIPNFCSSNDNSNSKERPEPCTNNAMQLDVFAPHPLHWARLNVHHGGKKTVGLLQPDTIPALVLRSGDWTGFMPFCKFSCRKGACGMQDSRDLASCLGSFA